MKSDRIQCVKHGEQDLAIACIHICRAIDGGDQVGFFWSTETSGPRPDAWCSDCEQWSCDNRDAPMEDWLKTADFQLLCVFCWDEAKQKLYSIHHSSQ